jgi:hypothetical protein
MQPNLAAIVGNNKEHRVGLSVMNRLLLHVNAIASIAAIVGLNSV